MPEPNFAHEYVDGIPWEETPAFAFSNDSQAYLEAFADVLEKIPNKENRISFEQDTWDFNPYFYAVHSDSLRFPFAFCPEEIRNYAKFFVLHCIMDRRKISTVNSRYWAAASVLKSIMETTSHKSVDIITTDDIISEVAGRNVSPSTAHNLYEGVCQMYCFMTRNYRLDFPVDINEIRKLAAQERTAAKQAAEENKLPDIPEEYFNFILNAAVRAMNDDSEDYNVRATACMIVMLSQLGMRIGDLMALSVDSLFFKKLARSGNTAYYIHYTSRKPSKPHSPMVEFDIFCNDLCAQAFLKLKELRGQCEFSSEPFLYVLDGNNATNDTLPVKNQRFGREMKKFLYSHLREISSRKWDGVKMSSLQVYDSASKKAMTVKVSAPDTRQFRVHLCTALYEKGVPLAYIQRYMGHLSEYMLGYYIRPKDTYQENMAFSEKIIQEIAGNDATPLGLFGEELKANIKKFISENNFNVQTDIAAIVKAMGDKIVIRGKTGGVCIKTSMMPCARDGRTDEIMCAYDACPNLYRFYFTLPSSYASFKTMRESYRTNLENGYNRAAQKERNKIRNLLRGRLIPELDELDREISLRGADAILAERPELIDIINGKEAIREEIRPWMTE